ncbi:MAG TPA: SAF domain-containing protein [Anaerolineales bacterium]|nr:SAF domain-containing protein [Anaerolineales bacterium]
MRRGRLLILLGLILIFGLLAVYFALPILFPAQQPVDTGQPQQPVATDLTDVVIVQQAILRGEEISEGKVAIVQIPRERAFAGMFTALDQVIGMKSLFDLEQGAFLTESMVSDQAVELAGSEASLYIQDGMVGVSIPINRLSSVSYGLRPGDRVNVIVSLLFVDLDTQFQSALPNYSSAVIAPGPAIVVSFSEESTDGSAESVSVTTNELLQTLTAQIVAGGAVSPIGRLDLDPTLGQPFYIVPSETQRPRSVSQTLIQNAMVLQVGTFKLEAEVEAEAAAAEAEAAAAQDPAAEEGEEAAPVAPVIVPPDVITLVVSYQDAVTLNYLVLNGARLSLAMRPSEDTTIAETEAVTLQFLLDQYNMFVPARQPYGLEPRIDQLLFPTLPNDAATP